MSNWSPNVILIDADYLDAVLKDMADCFEPIVKRPLGKGDLCHWLDCVALDGGLRQGKNAVQAIFLHEKAKTQLDHFLPGHFHDELDGKAFEDFIGEFVMQSFPVEDVVSKSEFFVQSLDAVLEGKDVERVFVVANLESYGQEIVRSIAQSKGKEVRCFTMHPLKGADCLQETLGYSLLAALGIRGDELGA